MSSEIILSNMTFKCHQCLDGLANVDDMLFQRGIDVPFYWHIPRLGRCAMNDVLGSFMHLTLAADAGGSQGHDQLEVCTFSHHKSYFVFPVVLSTNVSHRLLRSFTSPLRFPMRTLTLQHTKALTVPNALN